MKMMKLEEGSNPSEPTHPKDNSDELKKAQESLDTEAEKKKQQEEKDAIEHAITQSMDRYHDAMRATIDEIVKGRPRKERRDK